MPLLHATALSRRQFLKFLACLASLPIVTQWPSFANSTAGNSIGWIIPLNGPMPPASRTVTGKPGSLMKILTMMVLLENGLIHPDKPFECTGSADPKLTPGHRLDCSHAHGVVTLSDAFAVSCNAYFIHAIQNMSPGSFSDMWKRCFPQRALKTQPSTLSLPSYALGYSPYVALSASDLLHWMHDIATDGKNNPNLHSISQNTWAMLHHAMQAAGRWGTGKNADPADRYELALKTGTTRQGDHFESWCSGYFPAWNPKYVFCVRAYQGTSEEAAIPALRKQLSQLNFKRPKP